MSEWQTRMTQNHLPKGVWVQVPLQALYRINCERYVQQFLFHFKVKRNCILVVLQDPFDLMVEEYASGQSSHRPDVTRNASEVRILPLLFRTNGQMMHTGIQSN